MDLVIVLIFLLCGKGRGVNKMTGIIKMKLKILEPKEIIRARLLTAVRSAMSGAVIKAVPSIRTRIRNAFKGSIMATQAYMSIVDGHGKGELRPELGINEGQRRMDAIIDVWLNSLKITFSVKTTRTQAQVSLQITMIQSDWDDVLQRSEAIIFGPFLKSDRPLQWLKWLLIEGRRIIIRDYNVKIISNASQRKFSRTGEALMIKIEKGRKRNWKVPDKYVVTNLN